MAVVGVLLLNSVSILRLAVVYLCIIVKLVRITNIVIPVWMMIIVDGVNLVLHAKVRNMLHQILAHSFHIHVHHIVQVQKDVLIVMLKRDVDGALQTINVWTFWKLLVMECGCIVVEIHHSDHQTNVVLMEVHLLEECF